MIFKIVTHRTCHSPIRRELEQDAGDHLLFWELTLGFLTTGKAEQVPREGPEPGELGVGATY